MRRVYEFECVHTVTYAEHCVATRVEVLFYTAYMSKLITRSPLSRVVSFAQKGF